jgi:hypothetical protein
VEGDAAEERALRYVPAAYEVDDALGRAFFASESLNMVPRTHAATFRAIHDDAAAR